MVSRTNIEEANRQIQLMHQKLHLLETQLKEKRDTLEQEATNHSLALDNLAARKDAEIKELGHKLSIANKNNKILSTKLKGSNVKLTMLEQKCNMLTELLNYKSTLSSMLGLMEKCSSSVNGITEPSIRSGNHILSSPTSSHKNDELGVENMDDDMAEATESLGHPSPTIRHLARSFKRTSNRHFSISEDEVDEDEDDHMDRVFGRLKQEKELYL